MAYVQGLAWSPDDSRAYMLTTLKESYDTQEMITVFEKPLVDETNYSYSYASDATSDIIRTSYSLVSLGRGTGGDEQLLVSRFNDFSLVHINKSSAKRDVYNVDYLPDNIAIDVTVSTSDQSAYFLWFNTDLRALAVTKFSTALPVDMRKYGPEMVVYWADNESIVDDFRGRLDVLKDTNTGN